MADVNDTAKSSFALSASGGEGVAQGVNQGANWAASQASLNLQKQSHDLQMQQFKQQKREFDVKIGQQMFGELTDVALMPNGEVKNARMEGLKSFAQQSGIPFDDTWTASLKDKNFQPKWAELVSAMSSVQIKNPEAFEEAMSRMVAMGGQKASLGLLEQVVKGANLVTTANIKANTAEKVANIGAGARVESAGIAAGATVNRIESTDRRMAQKTYDQQNKPIAFALDGAARAMSLLDAVQNPKSEDDRIRATKQFRTLLAGEEARLYTQKSNFGEGTQEAIAINSYAGKFKDLMSQVADEPVDTVSPENLQQARNLYKELSDTYMQAHDRMASSIIGGSTPAQTEAIRGRAAAFQKQYGKKFGGWKGEGVEGVGTPGQEEAAKQLDSKQLEAARLLKIKLDETPPGPAKTSLMQRIQKSVAPEIRQKVGLQ